MSSSDKDHKVIKADKKLQAKAGTGDIDRKAVDHADNFLQQNKVVYADVVAPILLQLRTEFEQFKSSPDGQEAAVKKIKNAIMDLKASAATFKYPLISKICSPLLLHLENSNNFDKETFKIIELLYHIVSIVVKTDESEMDKTLSRNLESAFIAACTKISQKKK
ncbi:MAG: hypothetical protein WBK77_10480 [Alphaproteobacteria bacterium]